MSLLPYGQEQTQAFFAAFLETELGSRMDREGLLTNANVRTLVKRAQAAVDYDAITLAQFVAVAKSAYLNGELEPEREEPEPEPEPEPAPKPLTASQKAWQECRIYTETHSAKDCENRAKADSVYAAYLHKLRVGEFEASQTQVGDAVVNLNVKKPLVKGKVTAEVVQFAEDYRTMSVAQVKSLLSPGASGEVAAKYYQKLFDAACGAGLI